MSYEWESGRNLKQITEGENTYSYVYNKYGYRTSKTVNGVTTCFNVNENGLVVDQTDGTDILFFEYDNYGRPLGFVRDYIQYFYNTGDGSLC
ncbi:MAG: hypothetical protein ACI4IL_06810 [Eubacterium sp.]